MTTIRERIAAAEARPNVTAVELALLAGVSVKTIRRLGRSGGLPTLQVGRSVRFPREACLYAMKRHDIEGTVEA